MKRAESSSGAGELIRDQRNQPDPAVARRRRIWSDPPAVIAGSRPASRTNWTASRDGLVRDAENACLIQIIKNWATTAEGRAETLAINSLLGLEEAEQIEAASREAKDQSNPERQDPGREQAQNEPRLAARALPRIKRSSISTIT